MAALIGLVLLIGWAFGFLPGGWLVLWFAICISIIVVSWWQGTYGKETRQHGNNPGDL